jgi:hypothetical protein
MRSALQAIATPLHEDDFDVLQEAVEDRGGGGNITEEVSPVLRGAVGRDHGGQPFMDAA